MRTLLLIVAALLLAVGGAIAAHLIQYRQTDTVAKIGSLQLTSHRQAEPDVRIGYGLLVAGAVLAVVALSRKP